MSGLVWGGRKGDGGERERERKRKGKEMGNEGLDVSLLFFFFVFLLPRAFPFFVPWFLPRPPTGYNNNQAFSPFRTPSVCLCV